MDRKQAEEVFSILTPQWPEDAVVRVFFRSRTGATHGLSLDNPEKLASLTEWASANGWNSYVQMNPTRRRSGSRVSSADISHWSWFLVDIDPIREPNQIDDITEWVVSFVRNYFGVIDLKYTLIHSGRGRQLWFPLPMQALYQGVLPTELLVRIDPIPRQFDYPLDPEVGTKKVRYLDAAPRVMGYWLDVMKKRVEQMFPDSGVTIDTCASDLPRVMRLPFTWNFKSDRPTGILHHDEGYNPGLGNKLIGYAPYSLWKEPEPSQMGAVDDTTPWQKFLTSTTVGARIFLTEGANEGGRHRAATAALLSLKELGCGREQTLAALLWGADLCSPALHGREIIPMIERHFPEGGTR